MSKRSYNQVATVLNTVSRNTRSKRPRLQLGLSHKKHNPWISATKTYNYMTDDPLIDWLENTGVKKRVRSDSIDKSVITETFSDFIKRKGIDFEQHVINHIHENIHPVVKVSDYYTIDGVKKAKELMTAGVPILHSVPLCHTSSKTYGVADLVVRSDYLLSLAPNVVQETEELLHGSRLSPNYHYVIIDIKYSTLRLNSKGRCLLNQGSMAAYKSQVWIYNRALSEFQRYTPKSAYILGRRWTYTSKKKTYSNESCFDRLGVVDMVGYDALIIKKAHSAVKWCRDVRNNGMKWTVKPPTRDELYPNMCRDNFRWNSTKKEIANNLGEISQVWMCGVKNRRVAFSNGVRDWRDPRATAERLGVTGKRAVIVDKMLTINNQDENTVLPLTITENTMKWRDVKNEIFVDFETFSDVFLNEEEKVTDQPRVNLIYQIGLGYVDETGWTYKYFICHEPTKKEEYRVMKEFMDFMVERDFPTAWYWHAEDNFWKRSCRQQFERPDISHEDKEEIIHWNMSEHWRDMRKLFVGEQVVVKGCFGYALKPIGRALKNMNLITTPLESECTNGLTAMVQAWKCYKKFDRPWKCGAMKDVTQYNEYDCRVLCDILTYLRKSH